MSEIEWKIEDGTLYVQHHYSSEWEEADADEAASILRAAVEAEREAYAKIAEDCACQDFGMQQQAVAIATAIRARGET